MNDKRNNEKDANSTDSIIRSIQSDLENLKVYILQGRFNFSSEEAKIVTAVENQVTNSLRYKNQELISVLDKLTNNFSEQNRIVNENVLTLAKYFEQMSNAFAVFSTTVTDKISSLEEAVNALSTRIDGMGEELAPILEINEKTAAQADALSEFNEKFNRLEYQASEIGNAVLSKIDEVTDKQEDDSLSKSHALVMTTLERLTSNVDKLKTEDNERAEAILKELREFKTSISRIDTTSAGADEELSDSFTSLRNELENITRIVEDEEKGEEKQEDYDIIPSAIKQVADDIESNLHDILSLEAQEENKNENT